MKTKRLLWIALFAIFACCLISCSKKGEIKIGVILPLTGPGAIYGDDLRRGIETAYQESPLKEKIQLIYEDDAADVTTGINALNNLSFRNVDMVIGGIMSNVANGMLPIINDKRILLLSPKATDVGLSRENDYFFRIWPTDDVDGKYAATFITDSLHLKRIAVLYDNGTYGVGINKEFRDNLTSKEVEVVFDEGYFGGQTDFKTQIAKIKKANPDVLFLPSYYKEAVLILKQLNELNCDFYIAGVSSFFESEIKKSAGELADKVFFTYPQYSSNSQNPPTRHFVEAFTLNYKDREPNAFSAHGYDAFKILETNIQSLLSEGKEINASNMKQSMEEMEVFHGATGNLEFDINGDAKKGLQIIWLKDLVF